MTSPNQGSDLTSPVGLPTTPAVGGFISIAPPWHPQNFILDAVFIKDGSKRILRLGGSDVVIRWLKQYVGSLVTTYVPSLGIAWTSTLARRKKYGYLYVRVPARLRRLLEPIWLAGSPIPVIVSIPPVTMSAPRTGQRGARGSTTWPASPAGRSSGQNEDKG
jgi:hypothetical protein